MTSCVYLDFNDAIAPNAYALICRGCLDSLAKQNITLVEGMELTVSDGELIATGIVGKTKEGEGWPGIGIWMIAIDKDGVRDLPANPT